MIVTLQELWLGYVYFTIVVGLWGSMYRDNMTISMLGAYFACIIGNSLYCFIKLQPWPALFDDQVCEKNLFIWICKPVGCVYSSKKYFYRVGYWLSMQPVGNIRSTVYWRILISGWCIPFRVRFEITVDLEVVVFPELTCCRVPSSRYRLRVRKLVPYLIARENLRLGILTDQVAKALST